MRRRSSKAASKTPHRTHHRAKETPCRQCVESFAPRNISPKRQRIDTHAADANLDALAPRGKRTGGARPSGSVGTESRDHAREDFTTARKLRQRNADIFDRIYFRNHPSLARLSIGFVSDFWTDLREYMRIAQHPRQTWAPARSSQLKTPPTPVRAPFCTTASAPTFARPWQAPRYVVRVVIARYPAAIDRLQLESIVCRYRCWLIAQ